MPTATIQHTAMQPTNPFNNNYYTILDSGASDNYFTEQAPAESTMQDHDPIRVTIPDGTVLESTQKSTLNLPKLPETAREGYTIPGL